MSLLYLQHLSYKGAPVRQTEYLNIIGRTPAVTDPHKKRNSHQSTVPVYR